MGIYNRGRSQLSKVFYTAYSLNPNLKVKFKGIAFGNSSDELFNYYDLTFVGGDAGLNVEDTITLISSSTLIQVKAIVKQISSNVYTVQASRDEMDIVLSSTDDWTLDETDGTLLATKFEHNFAWSEFESQSDNYYVSSNIEGLTLNFSKANTDKDYYIDENDAIKIRFGVPHKLIDSNGNKMSFTTDEIYIYLTLYDDTNEYDYFAFYVNLKGGSKEDISLTYYPDSLEKWRFEINIALKDVFNRMELMRGENNLIYFENSSNENKDYAFLSTDFTGDVNTDITISKNDIEFNTFKICENINDTDNTGIIVQSDELILNWLDGSTGDEYKILDGSDTYIINSSRRDLIYYPIESIIDNPYSYIIDLDLDYNYTIGSTLTLKKGSYEFDFIVERKLNTNSYVISGDNYNFSQIFENQSGWYEKNSLNDLQIIYDKFRDYAFIDTTIEFYENNYSGSDNEITLTDGTTELTFSTVQLNDTTYIINGNQSDKNKLTVVDWYDERTGVRLKDINLKNYPFKLFGRIYQIEINKLFTETVYIDEPYWDLFKRLKTAEGYLQSGKELIQTSYMNQAIKFAKDITNPYNNKEIIVSQDYYRFVEYDSNGIGIWGKNLYDIYDLAKDSAGDIIYQTNGLPEYELIESANPVYTYYEDGIIKFNLTDFDFPLDIDKYTDINPENFVVKGYVLRIIQYNVNFNFNPYKFILIKNGVKFVYNVLDDKDIIVEYNKNFEYGISIDYDTETGIINNPTVGKFILQKILLFSNN